MPRSQKQSKRVPLARKYAISKKAKEAARKVKRAAKKNPSLRKKLRKDLGIPNLNPFKAQILERLEAQQKALRFHEQSRQRKYQELAARKRLGGDDEYAGLLADAAARAAAYEGTAGEAVVDDGTRDLALNASAGESTRRAFYRHVKSILEKADILLEVLDARDPLSCRAPAVEALALSMEPPKRIVLVLNKIDLVPPETVQHWLTYLRKDFPTVAFKASTQHQRSHLAAPGGGAINKATEHGDVLTGSGAAGADTLLQLLKNYSRSHELKKSIVVGVLGYPNVGKSSLINSLKRSRAVGVSAMPGFTKTLQEVSLDSKITLIDCPGVIFDDDDSDGNAGLLLRNCVNVDAIEDPESAVDGILQRCAPEKLMALYSIPAFDNTAEFLAHVAISRGKVGKGHVPDRAAAAKAVLHDWNSGKIPFFVLPPEESVGVGPGMAIDGEEVVPTKAGDKKARKSTTAAAPETLLRDEGDIDSAAIVTGWAKEFKMDEILAAEAEMLAELHKPGHAGAGTSDFVAVASAPSSAHVKATSRKAQDAAARFLAISEDQMDEDDEGADDDEDDDEEDDDGLDEDEEGDEEEEEMPAAPVVANASLKSKNRGSYNFTQHFKKK